MSTGGKAKGTSTSRRRIEGEEHIIQREGSAVWQIRFSIGSHRFRESSGTESKERAAELAIRRYQQEWDRIKLGVEQKPELTLNEAFARFYVEQAKGTAWGEGGQKYILRVILETMGRNTLLSHLSDARVNDMLQAVRVRQHPQEGRGPRERDASQATLNRYLAALSSVCKRARKVWQVNVGDWSLEHHVGKESEGREVFLDREQAKRLVSVAVPHLRPIILLALMTGLRRGNVLELTWERISLDMGRAVLIQKGDRRLGVVLPPPAIDLLCRLWPDPQERAGRVFVLGNPNVPCDCARCRSPAWAGRPLAGVKRSFATAAKVAGLLDMPAGRLRFHDLRHTAASWMLDVGGDLKVVQSVLGHATVTTTARYAHLLPGRKEEVVGAAAAGLVWPLTIEGKKVGNGADQ